MLKFSNVKQRIGDEAGLLNGVLGLLGSDYKKLPIYEESGRKITTKDKVYNDCVKIKVYIPFELNLLIFTIIDKLYYLYSKFSTLMKIAKELGTRNCDLNGANNLVCTIVISLFFTTSHN
ncbi:hypothetical protein AHAS_Ahas04G0075200 [Arachis hypogaea]